MRTNTWKKAKAYGSLALTLALVGVILLPLVWAALTSVRPFSEVLSDEPKIIPRQFTFEAYRTFWREAPFGRYFANSVIVASGTTLIALTFSYLAAYAFARLKFRGSRILIMLVVISQMLPGSSILIPVFRVIRAFGLMDTQMGLILAHTGFAIPFCTWLLSGYLRAVPRELEEAGFVDGCTRLQAIFHVLMPVTAPAVVAVGTFAFLLSWNEFLFAYVLAPDQAVTLPVALRDVFLTQYVNKYDQLFAASFLFSIPPIALFAMLQRYFVQGLTAGAVKE